MTRARLIQIATLLFGLGLGIAGVRSELESRGATKAKAADAASATLENRRGRYVERVLIAVPLAQLAAAGADVAPIICGPAPEGGDQAYTDCLNANGEATFGERYCRTSDGVEVARGGELAVTPEMRDRFISDRDPGIDYTLVRGATIDKDAELAARGLMRCPDPGGP